MTIGSLLQQFEFWCSAEELRKAQEKLRLELFHNESSNEKKFNQEVQDVNSSHNSNSADDDLHSQSSFSNVDQSFSGSVPSSPRGRKFKFRRRKNNQTNASVGSSFMSRMGSLKKQRALNVVKRMRKREPSISLEETKLIYCWSISQIIARSTVHFIDNVVKKRKHEQDRKPLSTKRLDPSKGALYLIAKQKIADAKRHMQVYLKIAIPFILNLRRHRVATKRIRSYFEAHAKATRFPRCVKTFHRKLLVCQRTWRETWKARRTSVLTGLYQINNTYNKQVRTRYLISNRPTTSIVLTHNKTYHVKPHGIVKEFIQQTNPVSFVDKGSAALTNPGKLMNEVSLSDDVLLFKIKHKIIIDYKEARREEHVQKILKYLTHSDYVFNTKAKDLTKPCIEIERPHSRVMIPAEDVLMMVEKATELQRALQMNFFEKTKRRYSHIVRHPAHLEVISRRQWLVLVAESRRAEHEFVSSCQDLNIFDLSDWMSTTLPPLNKYIFQNHPPLLRNLFIEDLEKMKVN